MDNLLSSLKDDLIAETDDISFSDEESETSPKKNIIIENNSVPAINKTTPCMLIN